MFLNKTFAANRELAGNFPAENVGRTKGLLALRNIVNECNSRAELMSMKLDQQKLKEDASQIREVTIKVSRLLEEAPKKQEAIQRRVAALEYRMNFIMGIIQETKAQWNVK